MSFSLDQSLTKNQRLNSEVYSILLRQSKDWPFFLFNCGNNIKQIQEFSTYLVVSHWLIQQKGHTYKFLSENKVFEGQTMVNEAELEYLQGQPLGFDTMYLALTDGNMQVRFSLKVVRES